MAKPISNAENNFGKQLLEIARKKKEQTQELRLVVESFLVFPFSLPC